MGFEDLASELHKQAEAEGRKLEHAAEKSAEKIEEEAREAAEAAARSAKKDAAAYAKQQSSERLTSAKLTAKKILDEARDSAVEASLKQVWLAFKSESLKKSNYPAILDRLVREGIRELGGKDAAVYVRDEDREFVPGYKPKLPAEYSGGAILESQDGKVRVNKTLEEAFAQKKTDLRKQIYDKLF